MALFRSSDARGVPRALMGFDDAVERWVETVRSPALDRIAYPLSSSADHSLLWHGIGIIRAVHDHDPAFALRFSAAMGIESLITNVVVKSAFQRLRPHRPPDVPMLYGLRQPVTSSFPSGHATAAFFAATLLARGSHTAPAWYALAALVAATRVYVRLHHASDIVAGAALGIALGYALAPVLPT
ncbi:MAG: rane-associated phospholipid phosphatase [Actinomycetia bacterium]|nr:rane-associated phospholipid phosphatase [Actinomycetes bacterium]